MRKIAPSKLVLGSLSLATLGTTVLALGDLFPPQLLRLLDLIGPNSICAVDYVVSRIQFVMYLLMGGLVLVSVIYAIAAAYKYIRSEGDPGEMEKAQKSIKAIFYGIGAMIVTVIGIVLIYAVLGAEPTNPQLYQVCISAPESKGCKACQESVDNPICIKCEKQYKDACMKFRETGASNEALQAGLEADCQTEFQVN